ncbi:MAG: hypothetical protein H6936_02875 [Burkholderiales bacterium]|nr:hypothetical protein [Nitrosomonas sp.]MCP5273799.1 hypothetical protein [Burkholderiales bacterium]
MNTDRAFDDIDDVADGMMPDSRIIEIIDEMELAKDDFDYLDETDIQHELVEIH